MAVIATAEWLPDQAPLGNQGSTVIKNAVPGATSYGPFKRLVTTTDALGARPRGAIEALDDTANVFNFAGDASKLYKLVGNSWTDVSKSGGYSTGTNERWEFERWKGKVIATNFSDSPQYIEFSGSAFADLTTAFKARHLAIVRDFVVFANTNDSTDGDVRHRIRWSAFGDETDYTADPTTGADVRDLNVGGGIQRVVGGQYGVIVSEKSTFRQTWTGAPTWFQIDEVLPGVGTVSPGSVVRLGDMVFFISEQGFVALQSGSAATYIGANKVDKFIRTNLDESNKHRISAVADPRSGRIMWAYPGPGNTGGRPNFIIVFDIASNKWSLIDQECEFIWRSGSVAKTLEELDDENLGSELVTNGTFAADSGWTKGTGWTIGSGTAAHAAGTASDLEQTISVVEDTFYRIEFDVSSTTAGSVTPKIGGTSGTAVTADATDIKQTIRAGAGGNVVFSASSDFDGAIDNVSVKAATNLDEMEVSLDSAQWKGGAPALSAFNSDFENGNFTGSAMQATIETGETELHAGFRTHLNSFTPLVDGGTVTAQVGTRNRQVDDVTWGPVLSQRPSGYVRCRSNARYHRVRLIVDDEWRDALGVQIEKSDARRAGKR